MNHSELSAVASSVDTCAKSGGAVFSAGWSTPPVAETRDNTPRHINAASTGIAEEERHEGVTAADFLVEDAVRPETSVHPDSAPDRGLWLFEDATRRHEHWERLRQANPFEVEAHELSERYSSGLLKRSLDVLGSLFLLIVLFPLLFLAAVLIRLDSPGPVFFLHDRVGKGGRRFLLWKFRSMRASVPRYELSPRSANDVRLTRVGRLIRRMSVDELPQLINVLRGEMSLVGPRPEMPFIVARYSSRERKRLSAKPGITGLWQISAARAFPIHENLQYDLHYIQNQNVLLDCAILVRTITAVLGGVGAV
jgi:lipopolysaccharide/colanic/teichoic acid biosynthesis glycosyltransferase